jgi:23S rRNA pseudouridine955/2504/2580 synthase
MKDIQIIYENDEIIIINKSAGMSVQGGEKIAHPLDKELPLLLGYPIYLVHRLDKDTSGLMIVSKTPQSASKWTKLIGEKSVQKEYDAICIGHPKKTSGVITENIIEKGISKTALTNFKVLKTISLTTETNEIIELSLLHLTLGTGRMHQIRIHLAHENLPIAGDDKHGNFKLNKVVRKLVGIKRLMLNASRLTLPDGQVFEIPLPTDMQGVVEK